MLVKINGQEQQLNREISLVEFLQAKQVNLDAVVVEYNFEIVPKEKWAEIYLKENDNLEVLHFVGGG